MGKIQLPHLPTGVPLLQLFDQKTFRDAHADYEAMVDQNDLAAKAYDIKAKLKTSLRRHTLPGYGWVFVKEEPAWRDFMQTLTLQDLSRALEVQAQVFTQLGETVSDESRRVYRSALKKFVEHVQEQPYYHTALGTKDAHVAPRMHTHKKRQAHWHRLKLKDMPQRVIDELDQVAHYLADTRSQTPYGGTLAESSVKRHRRELLDLLSWLHRFKGEPLETLSLECLVPKSAIADEVSATQVSVLLKEYVDWLQSALGLARRGQGFAVRSCIYVAELWEYEQITRVSFASTD